MWQQGLVGEAAASSPNGEEKATQPRTGATGWEGAGGTGEKSPPKASAGRAGQSGSAASWPPLGSRRGHGAGDRVVMKGGPWASRQGSRTALTPSLDLDVDKYWVWEMGFGSKV